MKLKNKLAIVTGGARDIGKAISLRLAEEGAKIIVNYLHSEDEAMITVDEIVAVGGTALAIKADTTNSNDVQELIRITRETFGETIDILVNNAGGLLGRKSLNDMDETFWNSVINLNLNSVYLMTKHVTPYMNFGSAVINFSSTAARDGGGAGASAYAASKGAVTSFTMAMAKELGPKGIRVNALCPGMIATSFHDKFTLTAVRQAYENNAPLRRQGRAAEIADAIVFLASNQSSFITGVNLDINGGVLFS